MIQVTINGNTYTLNQQGDAPPWGEQLSDILLALIDVANTNIGTGDILNTSFEPSNNISSVTNVTGLQFDAAIIRSAIIEYSIYRSTNSEEGSECGTMLATYSSTDDSWEVARYSVGDSGLTFTVTAGGQFQYTSTNMSGTGYSGLMRFRARAFQQ